MYKFNGKELDESTGYYYYGARYYDPGASIFLSVDPLAEDFPNFTSYHYVHNNPINLIDPTGMSAEEIDDTYTVSKNGKIQHLDDTKYIDKNGKEVDRLISLDKDGKQTNNIIDVDKGILKENRDKTVIGKNFSYYFGTNKGKMTQLFNFLANNTNVEWSILSETRNSWLTTSYSTDTEGGDQHCCFDF